MRISFWHFGQRSGSASHTLLMSSRHFLDGMQRGVFSEKALLKIIFY
jgi:hypothetical protein